MSKLTKSRTPFDSKKNTVTIYDGARNESGRSKTVEQLPGEGMPLTVVTTQPVVTEQIMESHRFWGINE
jgi:hypothetical protein